MSTPTNTEDLDDITMTPQELQALSELDRYHIYFAFLNIFCLLRKSVDSKHNCIFLIFVQNQYVT